MSAYSGKLSEGAYSIETISELPYQLKLSVDILSVKNFTLSANVLTKFNINLQAAGAKNNRTLVHHNFAAKDATPVNQGAHDTKIQDSFASFEFVATKSELGSILHKCDVDITIVHQANGKEIGKVAHPLKHLETGEQKKTPASVVIVSDKYVELKLDGKVTGLVRVVLYLEDLGVVKRADGKTLSQTSAAVPI